MKELETIGRPASPEHQFWRQAIQEIRKDSVKTVEEAAKQLIALVTLLSGIYFHAVTFSQLPQDGVFLKLLFVGPLALWVLCLLAAALVFVPQRYLISPYSPAEIENMVTDALSWKYRWLWISFIVLIFSLSWLVAAAWVYLDIFVPK